MNFLDKMERKFGRFAIPNISTYMIILFACGYVLQLINPYMETILALNPYLIFHGQVWRIISWILVPPSGLGPFTIIMLIFYWQIGNTLERVWGTFYYNVYLFQGVFLMILGSFVVYGLSFLWGDAAFSALVNSKVVMPQSMIFSILSGNFRVYYICMSIFLAFAATFPENEVLLMFIIPIKVKWMGIAYAALMIYEIFTVDVFTKVAIIVSLLNFVLFFAMTRRGTSLSPRQMKRRHTFQKKMQHAHVQQMQNARHKCAICGRTSETNPELEFRYCSKCEGSYEYCQEHLFTHTHVHTR